MIPFKYKKPTLRLSKPGHPTILLPPVLFHGTARMAIEQMKKLKQLGGSRLRFAADPGLAHMYASYKATPGYPQECITNKMGRHIYSPLPGFEYCFSEWKNGFKDGHVIQSIAIFKTDGFEREYPHNMGSDEGEGFRLSIMDERSPLRSLIYRNLIATLNFIPETLEIWLEVDQPDSWNELFLVPPPSQNEIKQHSNYPDPTTSFGRAYFGRNIFGYPERPLNDFAG